ncbi:MAG TPA: DUF305 domain-containing protein [Pyrinomonadaceae bacterium]|nr:DUF305 domain-containing protein [Pyrinomonadaceae bacterium]
MKLFRFCLILTTLLLVCFALNASAQEPVVIQPGAPGQATKTLPSTTRGKLPPVSGKDVEFMQGMIHHHAQAVEMVDLIEDRTKNKDVRLIGSKIAQSQTDEIKFMKRWLDMRGEPDHMTMAASPAKSEHAGHMAHGTPDAVEHLMPGMLTKAQMDRLRNAKDSEFDRLFLNGMIQHHNGALVMVDELFKAPGTGQDGELFNFASDVDTGQRAEIRSMQTLLDKKP